jgi:hypothetical protein
MGRPIDITKMQRNESLGDDVNDNIITIEQNIRNVIGKNRLTLKIN